MKYKTIFDRYFVGFGSANDGKWWSTETEPSNNYRVRHLFSIVNVAAPEDGRTMLRMILGPWQLCIARLSAE